jgi:hypothetical protein
MAALMAGALAGMGDARLIEHLQGLLASRACSRWRHRRRARDDGLSGLGRARVEGEGLLGDARQRRGAPQR